MINVPATRCVHSTAARATRPAARSAGSRTIVVIFTKFSISIPAARSCARKFRHERTLRLGVFGDAAIGGDADLSADIEGAAGPGDLDRLGILACRSRCIGSVDVTTLHRSLLGCAAHGNLIFVQVQTL